MPHFRHEMFYLRFQLKQVLTFRRFNATNRVSGIHAHVYQTSECPSTAVEAYLIPSKTDVPGPHHHLNLLVELQYFHYIVIPPLIEAAARVAAFPANPIVIVDVLVTFSHVHKNSLIFAFLFSISAFQIAP